MWNFENMFEKLGISTEESESLRQCLNDLEEARNDLINYLDMIRQNDISEYQKIMNEMFGDDYGVVLGPKSFSGKVYKYDSGVIGIDECGNKEEINMDDSNESHSSATIKIGCLLNMKFKSRYENTNVLVTPYDIGSILSNYGVLLVQLEGDSMIVYLPSNELTDIQEELLLAEINPRKDMFKIQYTKNGEILDNYKSIKK